MLEYLERSEKLGLVKQICEAQEIPLRNKISNRTT